MTYTSALAALADPTRRAVFEALRAGPRPVGAIAAGVPVSRPAVSQHLRVLKDAGLVTDSRAGTRRMYQLDPEGVARLRAHFDQVWEKALGAFQSTVASSVAPPKKGEKDDKDSRGSRRPKKHSRPRAH